MNTEKEFRKTSAMVSAIRKVTRADVVITTNPQFIRIQPASRSFEEWVVTLSMLQELSRLFNTTKINLHWESGWCGTEVTPGSPSEFEIIIRDWSFNEDGR